MIAMKNLPAKLFRLSLLLTGTLLALTAMAGPTIAIQTSQGPIIIELNREKAPITVNNFLRYVKEGFYDQTIFHRVIPGFMIQGGGFTKDMQEKITQAPIRNEANSDLKNQRGTIAMARRQDPHSATSQFFINHQDNLALDKRSEQDPQAAGYAVFGKVISGMETIDKIAHGKTGEIGPYQNVPITPVIIQSIRIIEP